MPEPRILLCGPAPGRMAPAKALEMVRGSDLPGVTKCILTDAKFDTEKAAKTFNIDAGYAPEPPRLRTMAGWAGEAADESSGQLADAIEVFALRAIIERDGPFDFVILQRRPAELERLWPELKDKLGDRPFFAFSRGNILFDLRGKRGPTFLAALWDLYSSGAAYGIDDYCFEAALAAAADALGWEQELTAPMTNPKANAEAVDA